MCVAGLYEVFLYGTSHVGRAPFWMVLSSNPPCVSDTVTCHYYVPILSRELSCPLAVVSVRRRETKGRNAFCQRKGAASLEGGGAASEARNSFNEQELRWACDHAFESDRSGGNAAFSSPLNPSFYGVLCAPPHVASIPLSRPSWSPSCPVLHICFSAHLSWPFFHLPPLRLVLAVLLASFLPYR